MVYQIADIGQFSYTFKNSYVVYCFRQREKGKELTRLYGKYPYNDREKMHGQSTNVAQRR